MKRNISRLLALVIVLILVFSLSACGSLSDADLIGIWDGSWEYNDMDIDQTLVFSADGTFTEVIYHDNVLSSADSGTYKVSGHKVRLSYDGLAGNMMDLSYRGGNLVNNGHKLVKE